MGSSLWQYTKNSDNEYNFTTDTGSVFSVAFAPVDFDGVSLYIPSLIRKQYIIKPNDSRVRNTVVAIMREFVQSKDCALYFVCDISDGRGEKRFRLFSYWFSLYGDDFEKIDFCAEDIYSAVIFKSSFKDKILVENLVRAFLGINC